MSCIQLAGEEWSFISCYSNSYPSFLFKKPPFMTLVCANSGGMLCCYIKPVLTVPKKLEHIARRELLNLNHTCKNTGQKYNGGSRASTEVSCSVCKVHKCSYQWTTNSHLSDSVFLHGTIQLICKQAEPTDVTQVYFWCTSNQNASALLLAKVL